MFHQTSAVPVSNNEISIPFRGLFSGYQQVGYGLQGALNSSRVGWEDESFSSDQFSSPWQLDPIVLALPTPSLCLALALSGPPPLFVLAP